MLLVGSGLWACNPPNLSASKPVSFDPRFTGDPNLNFMQSEQSAARFFDGPMRIPSLAIGYNDGRGWAEGGNNRMGAAVSPDDGDTFTPGLVSISSTSDPQIQKGLGDPWMATNAAHDRLFYTNLANTRINPTAPPDTIVITTRDDTASGWHAPFDGIPMYPTQDRVSRVFVDNGIDQSKIAVSQDAAEDIYLSYTCPNLGPNTCTIAQRDAVHVIRLRSPDRAFERLGFPESAPVDNPILGTDAGDPDAVFVAYQVRVAGAADMEIRVARSPDRGTSWPLEPFRSLVAEHVSADQRIKAVGNNNDLVPCRTDPEAPDNMTCNPERNPRAFLGQTCNPVPRLIGKWCTPAYAPLRNGIVMDYFVADDGYHYLAYEDDGVIYLSFSAPIDLPNNPLHGLNWSTPQFIGIGLKPDPNHPRDFQPAVAAVGARVLVIFYEQDPRSTLTFVSAFLSEDHADPTSGWTPIRLALDTNGDRIFFEPCAARTRPTTAYFGDYIDVIPMALPGMPSQAFYATWTDSRTPDGEPDMACIATSANAIPQHTYGVVVP